MPKFEKQYVHFMWSDELEGKMVFFANHISNLKKRVESNDEAFYADVTQGEGNLPFRLSTRGVCWLFVYYDPYYELKAAREQGKVVQRYWKSEQEWEEHIGDDFTDDVSLYRIKPEEPEEKPITNRDLAQWLAEGYGQYMDVDFKVARTYYFYDCCEALADDAPINKDIRVRLWGDTEWHVPTRKYMYMRSENDEDQEWNQC